MRNNGDMEIPQKLKYLFEINRTSIMRRHLLKKGRTKENGVQTIPVDLSLIHI